MPSQAKKKTQTYHAMMTVTRTEEWCVDASSVEEAKALLAAGEGHRCNIGDAVHVELGQLFDNH
jgi:hypothetical protein